MKISIACTHPSGLLGGGQRGRGVGSFASFHFIVQGAWFNVTCSGELGARRSSETINHWTIFIYVKQGEGKYEGEWVKNWGATWISVLLGKNTSFVEDGFAPRIFRNCHKPFSIYLCKKKFYFLFYHYLRDEEDIKIIYRSFHEVSYTSFYTARSKIFFKLARILFTMRETSELITKNQLIKGVILLVCKLTIFFVSRSLKSYESQDFSLCYQRASRIRIPMVQR